MKLSIVIPAYNEEGAIVSIIERCLGARPTILRDTDLTEVEIIVVSDGSSDQTVARARPYDVRGLIRLIAYPSNAGYGAALKRGFREATGELVSFLDADGTCDPLHFVPLVNAVLRDGADVACGCRMTPTSRMPPLRILGNRIFRAIINLVAQTQIRDSASGMRVIRRDSLPRIYPLPDGLHFTPAMSCRAALDSSLRMVEIDMHYEERIGESKLRVIDDGIRFLKIILDIALTYRPLRLYGGVAGAFLLLAAGIGLSIAYAKFVNPGYERLPHWYLFRMMATLTATTIGLTLFIVGVVTDRVSVLVQGHQPPVGFFHEVVLKAMRDKTLFGVGATSVISGVVLNGSSLREWMSTGAVLVEHWWAYAVTGGFLIITGVLVMAMAILDRVLLLLGARRTYLNERLASDVGTVALARKASSTASGISLPLADATGESTG